MRRLLAVLGVSAAALWSYGCSHTEPGAGSNTNWLRPCSTDADCGSGARCLCDVCTEACEKSCDTLPGAVCAKAGSAAAREQCAGTADEVSAPGLCLPACSSEAPCGEGQLCSEGRCLQIAGVAPKENGCGAVAELKLTDTPQRLQARYGTWFSEQLYLPASYPEAPTDWTEPAPPAAIIARVTDASGRAVSGCAVRFLTGEHAGRVFAEAPRTDENGETRAYWVAGDARSETLQALLVEDGGAVLSASVRGTAYSNDEGPQADESVRSVVAHPAILDLGYDWPASSNAVRVELSPKTFPHHAFYAAIGFDGFFAGLQNTGDADAETSEVSADARVLIASVWNRPDGDVQQLFQVDGLDCSPHTQGLGGIQCDLHDAWQVGEDYVLELQRATLALGESGADYAALGYLTDACQSQVGCTDFTLFFGRKSDASLQRVVAYRYQTAELASGFGSLVQAYADLPSQNSCLATPTYDVAFLPFLENAGAFQAVSSGRFSARYTSWENDVCANYAARADTSGFRLTTGGPRPLERPLLPGEPARVLELP